MELTDEVEGKGIHVTASGPVRVYVEVELGPDVDRYPVLPTAQLGTDHFVLAYQNGSNAPDRPTVQFASEFAVAASADDTTVIITPRSIPATGSNPEAGRVEYEVHLDQGDAYQLQAYTNDADLTGTQITSDKPVAVFAGHYQADVTGWGAGTGHMAEQLPPTSGWGTHSLTIAVVDNPGPDHFRIVAAQDGTAVTINGTEVGVFLRGQVFETNLDGPAEIIADRPILVAQYADNHVSMMLVPLPPTSSPGRTPGPRPA